MPYTTSTAEVSTSTTFLNATVSSPIYTTLDSTNVTLPITDMLYTTSASQVSTSTIFPNATISSPINTTTDGMVTPWSLHLLIPGSRALSSS